MKILIADDEDDITDVIANIINDSDFELSFDIAHDGRQAWELIQNGNYDIVFMDYHMPGLNGSEILKLMETHIDDQPIFCLVTADKAAVDRGHNYTNSLLFIEKPFEPEDILEVLEIFEARSL